MDCAASRDIQDRVAALESNFGRRDGDQQSLEHRVVQLENDMERLDALFPRDINSKKPAIELYDFVEAIVQDALFGVLRDVAGVHGDINRLSSRLAALEEKIRRDAEQRFWDLEDRLSRLESCDAGRVACDVMDLEISSHVAPLHDRLDEIERDLTAMRRARRARRISSRSKMKITPAKIARCAAKATKSNGQSN
jgi:outer membrane murein-binding lipoprotein Lpp